MPPARTQQEYEQQEQRDKLANSYQALLTEFSSSELKSVGNYSLGRLIGKGSFGKVYLAQHKLTNGTKVVLKSTSKNDPNLAREIHHHRQFLHPHIARLYEVIVTENSVWLALEWCPGNELYHHLLNHGRMEAAKVQKIFAQLVGAVSYVHQKSCVHRDLKLENILLDKNENVKLVDFGFTREYQGTTSYLQTWCGTVCYSAPEMLKGEKYAGEKVDVWSLGIILFALLCGELPYDEDDDGDTKAKILKDEPVYPEYLPDGAKDLIKKLLSKRPLLRPSLADVLKDPWLAEHAPQQQEILKIQQPAPFSTPLEKDTLQRMRSAGVNIDTIIEHVLAQRCDSLAGWWALLIEKEQRKEKRREKKRRERDETRSLRRLSAASGRLLALGEIHEGEILASPGSRGRQATRTSVAAEISVLPKVSETKPLVPEGGQAAAPPTSGQGAEPDSRPQSRPPPPPKDTHIVPAHRNRTASRGSQSMLRVVANNPELLSPQYVPAPQRKRRNLMQQPLKEQLAWVKQWFKDGTSRRSKSPTGGIGDSRQQTPRIIMNGNLGGERSLQDMKSPANLHLPEPAKRISFEDRPGIPTRAAVPARPRLNTTSSAGSNVQRKRQSLSPGTLTPHSSIRRSSAGLRGRKSTSSSVSSIRSAYQPHHQHTHSKASSTSSASVASPSGLSATSNSRLARSPHSSVKVLPSTPTGSTLPSNIRVSRRPPGSLGPLPVITDVRPGFMTDAPPSPGLPVFARRKRSVFKGPHAGGSPSGYGRTTIGGSGGARSGSAPRRASTEITGITEEDEEDIEEEEDVLDEEGGEDIEEVDQFGPVQQGNATDAENEVGTDGGEPFTEPVTPVTPGEDYLAAGRDPSRTGSSDGDLHPPRAGSRSATPLTAEALAKMEKEQGQK